MKSRLYGFLEGFNKAAGEPQWGGYGNPDLGQFECANVLVKPQLANGQTWMGERKKMPREKLEGMPEYDSKEGVPTLPRPQRLKLLQGQNQYEVLRPADKPFYPEVNRIKAYVEATQDKEFGMRGMNEVKEPLRFVQEATEAMQLRSRFSPEQFDRLIALGFSEEDISKAIEESMRKDVMKALENPKAYTRELDLASSIELMYNTWNTSRLNQNTNTSTGGGTANPNTFRAGGTAQENIPVRAKSGAMRMRRDMKELGITRREEGEQRQREREMPTKVFERGMRARMEAEESLLADSESVSNASPMFRKPGRPTGSGGKYTQTLEGAMKKAESAKMTAERFRMSEEDKPEFKITRKVTKK